MKCLITGAGGFVGSHLVTYLSGMDYEVRGIDLKYPEFEPSTAQEFVLGDLRNPIVCADAMRNIDVVYHLGASMGGIGFITKELASIAYDNTMIDLNMLKAATDAKVWRFFFSSSACAYNTRLQEESGGPPLREQDAWPACPERGYGLSKLYTEELCAYFNHDYGLDVRIARFHNCYGPKGAFAGGKEKAPAALCRKVAEAPGGGTITVWGDGNQTRSFLYVDDCVEGIYRLLHSGHSEPLNLGSDRLISIGDLAKMIIEISGKTLDLEFDPTKPQGVRGRNSDNEIMRQVLGWEPTTTLEDGLAETYFWIEQQVRRGPWKLPL